MICYVIILVVVVVVVVVVLCLVSSHSINQLVYNGIRIQPVQESFH